MQSPNLATEAGPTLASRRMIDPMRTTQSGHGSLGGTVFDAFSADSEFEQIFANALAAFAY